MNPDFFYRGAIDRAKDEPVYRARRIGLPAISFFLGWAKPTRVLQAHRHLLRDALQRAGPGGMGIDVCGGACVVADDDLLLLAARQGAGRLVLAFVLVGSLSAPYAVYELWIYPSGPMGH